jgi:hypothetical protein
LCLDLKSKIGKTINEFIKQFHVLEKRPDSAATTVRQFMNAMRLYILENKKENFESLMIKSREVSLKMESKADSTNRAKELQI